MQITPYCTSLASPESWSNHDVFHSRLMSHLPAVYLPLYFNRHVVVSVHAHGHMQQNIPN